MTLNLESKRDWDSADWGDFSGLGFVEPGFEGSDGSDVAAPFTVFCGLASWPMPARALPKMPYL